MGMKPTSYLESECIYRTVSALTCEPILSSYGKDNKSFKGFVLAGGLAPGLYLLQNILSETTDSVLTSFPPEVIKFKKEMSEVVDSAREASFRVGNTFVRELQEVVAKHKVSPDFPLIYGHTEFPGLDAYTVNLTDDFGKTRGPGLSIDEFIIPDINKLISKLPEPVTIITDSWLIHKIPELGEMEFETLEIRGQIPTPNIYIHKTSILCLRGYNV